MLSHCADVPSVAMANLAAFRGPNASDVDWAFYPGWWGAAARDTPMTPTITCLFDNRKYCHAGFVTCVVNAADACHRHWRTKD